MRYEAGASKILMDALFVRVALYAKEQGYAWFNLGAAPLSGLAEHRLAPTWHKVGALIFRRGEEFYPFEGLRAYKQKFNPVWTPHYLACRGGSGLAPDPGRRRRLDRRWAPGDDQEMNLNRTSFALALALALAAAAAADPAPAAPEPGTPPTAADASATTGPDGGQLRTVSAGRLRDIPLLAPAGAAREAPKGLAVLMSGTEGWTPERAAEAKALLDAGLIVLEVDFTVYRKALAASGDGCHYVVADFEALAQLAQRELGLRPICDPSSWGPDPGLAPSPMRPWQTPRTTPWAAPWRSASTTAWIPPWPSAPGPAPSPAGRAVSPMASTGPSRRP